MEEVGRTGACDGDELIDLLGDVYEVVASAAAPDPATAHSCNVAADTADTQQLQQVAATTPAARADAVPAMHSASASHECGGESEATKGPSAAAVSTSPAAKENAPPAAAAHDNTDNVIAVGRLMKERQLWRRNRPKGFFARPAPASLNPSGVLDIFHWRCVVPGPRNTMWHGGLFTVSMEFGNEYPWAPPKCRFDPVIFHPNVYKWGTVCMSLFDEHIKGWNMDATVLEILVALRDTLANPNVESPANPEAAKMFQEDGDRFLQLAKAETERASLPAARSFVGAECGAALDAAINDVAACDDMEMEEMETDSAMMATLDADAQMLVAQMDAVAGAGDSPAAHTANVDLIDD